MTVILNISRIGVFLILLLSSYLLPAQRIWGAEMYKETIEQKAMVDVIIYREGSPGDSIIFDWGDGTIETLPLGFSLLHVSGYHVDYYVGMHSYDTAGYYEISFRDSFLIKSVVNIESSGARSIFMQDTLNVFPEDHPFNANRGPDFFSMPFSIEVENGVYFHHAHFVIDEPFIDDYQQELVEFPSIGYSFPDATNGIYMDDARLVWDKPISPGIYAFCIKVREIRPDLYNPPDSVLMSTTHRAMMIEVDSSMLVSTPVPWLQGVVSISPNPAGDVLTLQYANFFVPMSVQIYDAAGRMQYQSELPATSSLKSISIPVAQWPPGMYIVHLQAGKERIVRKVIVK